MGFRDSLKNIARDFAQRRQIVHEQNLYLLKYKDVAKKQLKYNDISKMSVDELTETNANYEREAWLNKIDTLITPEGPTLASFFAFVFAPVNADELSQRLMKSSLVSSRNAELLKEKGGLFKIIGTLYQKNSEIEARKAMNVAMKDPSGIDSLLMTPRQVAALKVNFTEQYYADLRSLDMGASDYYDKVKEFNDMYNTSLKHLEQVAHNSGYTMDLVDDEEKYIVGIKAAKDKSYLDLYKNSSGPFGSYMIKESSGLFEGRFSTCDGHDDVKLRPRDRYNENEWVEEVNRFETVMDMMSRYTDEVAAASRSKNSLSSGESSLLRSNVRKLKRNINAFHDDGKKSYIKSMSNDLSVNEKQAGAIYDGNINVSYSDDTYNAFKFEIERAIDSYILSSRGLKIYPSRDDINNTNGAVLDNMYDKIKDSFASNAYYKDKNMSGKEILADLRLKYIATHKPADVMKLLTHGGYNFTQVPLNLETKRYSFYDKADESKGYENKDKAYESKSNENKDTKDKTDQDTRYKGVWNGKEVSFKRDCYNHHLTDEECEKLLAGEEIKFETTNKNGKQCVVSGKLADLEYNGRPYVGFSGQFSKNYSKDNDNRYSGEWNGRQVSFKREWSGHRFTDEECEKLLAGEEIEFEAKTKKGQSYVVKGRLNDLEYKGNSFVGFEKSAHIMPFVSSKDTSKADSEIEVHNESEDEGSIVSKPEPFPDVEIDSELLPFSDIDPNLSSKDIPEIDNESDVSPDEPEY